MDPGNLPLLRPVEHAVTGHMDVEFLASTELEPDPKGYHTGWWLKSGGLTTWDGAETLPICSMYGIFTYTFTINLGEM